MTPPILSNRPSHSPSPIMLGNTASELVEQFGASAFEAVHHSDLDGLIYFGGDGTIEYVNRAAMHIFGLNEEIVGRNIFELHEEGFDDIPVELIFPSDHFDRARNTYEEGVPSRSEMIVIQGDEQREIEVMWGPVRREGDIVGVVGSYRDVSSRPDIHDQLAFELSKIEKERRFFASLLDELEEGVFVFDEHMEIQLANTTALQLLDVAPPIEGLKVVECLDNSALSDPECAIEQLRRSLELETSIAELHRLEAPTDRMRRLEFRASPVGLGESRYVCTISDTTRRLEVSEIKLLGQIARSTTQVLEIEELRERIVDLVTRQLDIDFAVLTTHNGEAICPVAWRGLLIEKDMCIEPSRRPPLREALESGSPRRDDAWAWENGENDDLEQRGEQLIVPMLHEGEVLGTLHLGYIETPGDSSPSSSGHMPDIALAETLGNHVSAALRHVEVFERHHSDREWLEALLEALPLGVFIYDRRGDILSVNSAAIRITGYSDWSNFNTDSPPYRVLDAEDETPLARAEWPFFEAARRETYCEGDALLDFGTHRRDVAIQAAPLGDENGLSGMFVGIVDDRTERRRHDRRKDEFLSIASHELRSPLTPLTGVLQLARRQRERGDDVDLSLLVRAERQVSQLTRLIDGLLDLTRIETGRIEIERKRLELGAFVERAARPWEHHPQDIDLDIEGPEEPIDIAIDPDRIKQVITNLIDNAVKYSKTSSAVRIDVTARSDRAVIGIEDDGIGMDEETAARVFDRFFHGRDDEHDLRSMGLGLYICRQIVEQHDGSIHIETAEGEGTRIDIALPRNIDSPSHA